MPIILKRFLLPVYLRENALFWLIDASYAREREDRVGRDSLSTTSSPKSLSRSQGCCWESLYSFCRFPYHLGLHHQCRRTCLRSVQCPGRKREQSSSGMTVSMALHRNDVYSCPGTYNKIRLWQSLRRCEGCFDEKAGFHLAAYTDSQLQQVIRRSHLW